MRSLFIRFIWFSVFYFPYPIFAAHYFFHQQEIPSAMVLEDTGEVLNLQGIAVHKLFFYDNYVAAFYAIKMLHDPKEALEDRGAKRMWLYFLRSIYDFKEICAHGIEENNALETIQREQINISQFLKMIDYPFQQGDILVFDYVPNMGTKVMLKGTLRGAIKGNDFYNVILKIWLGWHPPSKKFRKDLFNLSQGIPMGQLSR